MLDNNGKKHPTLTPNKHLLVACIIGFATFFLFIITWQSVFIIFVPDSWDKNLTMIITFLIVVPIPVFIFDRLVPARCPKCNGEMFGSSFTPPYKECKKCSYRYEYSIFGDD
jgi:hypothetical protein